MTHATYPNEDAFDGTVNFCLAMKKLAASCVSEKREPLDLKYPKLCAEVLKEEEVIVELDCNLFEDASGGPNGTAPVRRTNPHSEPNLDINPMDY